MHKKFVVLLWRVASVCAASLFSASCALQSISSISHLAMNLACMQYAKIINYHVAVFTVGLSTQMSSQGFIFTLFIHLDTHTRTHTHPCRLKTAEAAGQSDRAIHQADTRTHRNAQFVDKGIKTETGQHFSTETNYTGTPWDEIKVF